MTVRYGICWNHRRPSRPAATISSDPTPASSAVTSVFSSTQAISSARSRLAKTGPGPVVNSPLRPLYIRWPIRSAGTRSGVNWTRPNVPPTTWASALTVAGLARPGTPSSRTWPRASSATSSRSSRWSCPTISRFSSNSTCSTSAGEGELGSAAWAAGGGRVVDTGGSLSLLPLSPLRVPGTPTRPSDGYPSLWLGTGYPDAGGVAWGGRGEGSSSRSFLVGRPGLELDGERLGRAAAHDRELDRVADLAAGQRLSELAHVPDRPAVERGDDVAAARYPLVRTLAAAQTGPSGRAG